jgi:hypothetical protein
VVFSCLGGQILLFARQSRFREYSGKKQDLTPVVGNIRARNKI